MRTNRWLMLLLVFSFTAAAFAAPGREEAPAAIPTVRVHLIDSFRMILDGSREVDTGGSIIAGLEGRMNVEWVVTAFTGYEVRAKQLLASRSPEADVLFYLSSHLSPTVLDQMATLDRFQATNPVPDFGDIFPGALDQFRSGGELKAIPFRNTIYLMFYNTKLYEQRLGTTSPPRTMDEFWNNVHRTSFRREDGAQVYGLATYGGADGRMLTILSKAYGAQIVDNEFNVRVTDRAMVRFVTDLKTAFDRGGVPPNLETLGEGDLNNLMCEGLAAHVLMPANFFAANYIRPDRCSVAGDISFAPYPAWAETGREMAEHYGAVWAMTIPKNIPADRQALAWEFIRHVSSPQQHHATLLNQNHPIRMSAYDVPAYREAQPVVPLLQMVSDDQVPMIAFYDGSSEALTIFGEEVTAALHGLKTVDAALESAKRRIEASLASYGLR